MEADGGNAPVLIEPDLGYIRALTEQGGDSLKKCMQCGTCSATCALSPDIDPFPRKEMVWAVWGMKDRLLKDPDVWLCHHCNDCTARCPRGARPGDVLAAVRQECVVHYAFPRFLARWMSRPQNIPLLLGIPAALIFAALLAKEPVEDALGITRDVGEGIVYAYSRFFPHWLLNVFFGFFTLLVVLACVVGLLRFWRAMKAGAAANAAGGGIAPNPPARGLISSIGVVLKSAVAHDRFSKCTQSQPRALSHLLVFFGFAGLTFVTLWVITARVNPLAQGAFVYPFTFWSPWKVLANAGGLAVLAGCLLMIRDRWKESGDAAAGAYFDWALIGSLILAVLTGFATEALHYLRLEPHRHIAYFVHLVFVFSVLMYMPYSKLAHMIYRGAAMVFAERIGRVAEEPAAPKAAAGPAAGSAVKDTGQDIAADNAQEDMTDAGDIKTRE